MTTFDERERAFESKFALDQDTEFRAHARRDRLAGLWAGELLGLSGEALESYVTGLIAVDMRTGGDEDVLRKIVTDLDGRATETEVRAKLDALMQDARAEIEGGV